MLFEVFKDFLERDGALFRILLKLWAKNLKIDQLGRAFNHFTDYIVIRAEVIDLKGKEECGSLLPH